MLSSKLKLTGRALCIREVILYLSKKEGRPTTFKKAVGLRLIHDLLWLNQEPPWYHVHHSAGHQQQQGIGGWPCAGGCCLW